MQTYATNQESEFYTALEIAEITGLDKNTILYRCKKGYYEGAVKTEPDRHNPHGMWLIPKGIIDSAIITKDVATLTRQVTPVELERAMSQAVATAIEPLLQRIDQLEAQLKEQNQEILLQIEETRAERKAKEPKGFWAKLFRRGN